MELENFFSLGDHLEKAEQEDNTLVTVLQLVDFEGLRDLLRKRLGYEDIREDDVLLLIRWQWRSF